MRHSFVTNFAGNIFLFSISILTVNDMNWYMTQLFVCVQMFRVIRLMLKFAFIIKLPIMCIKRK